MADVGRAVFASDYQSRKKRGFARTVSAETIHAGTITAESLLSVPSIMYEAAKALKALKPGQELKIVHHGDHVEFTIIDVTEDPS